MDFKITSYCLPILLLVCVIEANNTSSEGETRQPRGGGRIVKFYSEARPDSIICTNEGFRGDPNDCSVFYRCTKLGKGKYTAVRFQCPPATIYDPDTEVCNYPRSTKRSECGGLKEHVSPHYEVNDIEEIQELPSPITTKAPFQPPQVTPAVSFAPVTNKPFTQKPTFNKWQSIPTTIHPIPTSTKHQETTSYPWVSTTQNRFPVTPSATSFVSPQQNIYENICTSDGFMGDSVNCHKFYRCVGNQRSGFTKYEFSCSEPTVWDDDIKSCNHPWAVKKSRCGRINTIEGSETSTQSNVIPEVTTTVDSVTSNANKTIQSQLQIAYGANVHQTQTQIINNSAIQNQTQINYGDRVNMTENVWDKQNQSQISHGSAVSQSQTQTSYGDDVVQTQVQIDHSKQTSQSQVQITESTITSNKFTTTHGQYVTQKNNTNNTCSQSGFMGDYNDCKKFYRCVDNGRGGFTRHEFTCGEGTLWDQTIEACNHAWAVKECGGMHSSPVNQEITTKLPLSSSTQSYFTTTNKTIDNYYPITEISHVEDFEDVGYNNSHGMSSPGGVTKPTTETTHHNRIECKSSGFMGDAKDCQIFYNCVENGNGGYTKYEFKCGKGTLWDSDIGACNHARAVKRCGENSMSTTTEITSTTPSKLTTTPYTTSTVSQITTQNNDYDAGYGIHNQQSSQSSSTIIPTEVPQDNKNNANNICQSSGFMGDKNDCKKFYRCVDNGSGNYARYEFTCGEGTAWDSKIESCNHAWTVDNCKNSGIATSTTEATTQKKPMAIDEDSDSGYNIPGSSIDSEMTTQRTKPSTSTLKTTVSFGKDTCSNSGFIGDARDCKKFYRCVDSGDGTFIRYEFTCGGGTVWDQKIEACNHAWAVEKCGAYYESDHGVATTAAYNATMSDEHPVHEYPTPGYPVQSDEDTDKTTLSTASVSTSDISSVFCTKDGFVGDEKDCKIFYRCVNDGRGGFIKYEFKCGEGTVWDQKIEACNHAWAVKGCGAKNETSHNKNESTTEYMPITSSEHDYHSTEKTSSTTSSSYDYEISDVCKKEGFAGDRRDCKKFYRCVYNGQRLTKYDFTCGEGTYWNQIIQACDHASSEHPCDEKGNDMITKEPQHEKDEAYAETTTKVTTPSTTESQENMSPTKKPQSPETTCVSEGFIGDQYNCQKFYRCVDNGKGSFSKYDFTCGDGAIWDQELITCVHKSGSNGCSSSFTGSSSQPNEPSEENGNSYISSTPNIPHQSSTEKINVTHQTSTENTSSVHYHCTLEGFHANPNDCRKFIRCVNDGKGKLTQYDFTCGKGTIWIQEIMACDHDDGTASCYAQNEWSTKPQTNFETSTHLKPTSSPTATQNQSTDKYDGEYNTKVPQLLSDDCQSDGFYADKHDCKKYHRCVPNDSNGYIKYEFSCGEGTAWDANLQTCNHNTAVNNCQGTIQQENQTQSMVHDKISETESSISSTTQKPTTKSQENTTVSSNNACVNEGYFGNTKDCTKFYRCVDSGNGGFTKYDFTCGDGTIWDQDLITCNHPQDVVFSSCNQDHGVTSGNTSSSSGTSSTSTSTTTQSSESTTTTTESLSNCTQEETSKKPVSKNVTCTKAGYYADPNDCKKFYRCVDWDSNGERFSVYFFECGEGTIWDPALDTCNHEESVYPPRDCSNTQPQTTISGQEVTTTEQSPTHESTTREVPTTESTTSENTTTQQSTTSEIPTTESTTTETTTPQQPTTSEIPTTESTTSENTTTQQSTTSEIPTTESNTSGNTTTQQSTTSEVPTTELTTSENTTTQQPTTTEKTTTEQSTTSEQTTTQQSTTSEKTTTEQTTTSEQTTTPPSTTSVKTTTEYSTTTVQSTTQSSTTEETTTQQVDNTTEATTTEAVKESTTTDKTTTQESTTSGSTTTEMSTTVESMTQQSHTTEKTTTENAGSTDSTNCSTATESTTATESSTTEVSTSNATTTESSELTSTTEHQQATTTEETSPSSSCPDTDDNQFLFVCPTSFKRHPKYCNMFYQCTEDEDSNEVKVAVFNCPNNTIYDESKIQCVEGDKANKKCDGEIASRRRVKGLGANYKEPIVVTKDAQKCSTVGHMPFEKNSECSPAFLKCRKTKSGTLRGYVHRCPQNYVYWSISRRCEREEVLRDCKRTNNNWTGRWEIPIDRHDVAW